MKKFIIRTITGVLFVAIIVASFLRPLAMTALFALVTGMAIWEYSGIVNEHGGVSVNRFISTVAGVYLFIAVTAFCGGFVMSGAVFVPYLLTLVYLFVAELYARNQQPVATWGYTMLSQMWIALGFSTISVVSFFSLGYEVHFSFVLPLSIFVFLWANDSGAYLIGSLLGKHKLFPRISPNKSWEGSIGGGVLVIIVAILISILVKSYEMDCVLQTIPQWIGLGLVVVVFGTWGDLVESLFKRTLGIKDSGTILPGHGGILDRFDSSLLAFPAAVIYIYTLSII
ncbi:MAG: phosphatidate cytidylyltransferase [Prevotella sp.]|nr:phosphatidate cytidylyltransferase [Candidatus Equicola faecalis]